MSKQDGRPTPHYGTWTRKNRIALFAIISACFLLLAIVIANPVFRVVFAASSVLPLYITIVLLYTYYQFSTSGGDFQSKIHEVLIGQIGTRDGKLLDIGSGSASLIIKAVKNLPDIKAIGIDYWGNDWSEYSRRLCEDNAQVEGVAGRIEFLQGSAAKLPFPDGEFDLVISCLTFHEVKDEPDKANLLCEALRVLKSGGEFVFLDLFLDEHVFGSIDSLVDKMDASCAEVIKLDQTIDLPRLLLIKQCLGNAAIIKGVK
jgi:SAM-dependent methyltransferase